MDFGDGRRDVAFEERLRPERVSGETIRATLSRLLSVRWGCGPSAESPLLSHCRKEKKRRDRLMEIAGANPEWAVGFEDECWWSRVWPCPP